MPSVEVAFTPLPAHVRTARLIAIAVARRAGVPEEYLDEVRLAVGEACSRAVGVHRRVAPRTPVAVTLADERGRYTVTVTDAGQLEDGATQPDLATLDTAELAAPAEPGTIADPMADLLPPGFELAVITGLVDDVEVAAERDGTRLRMSWPAVDPMAPDPAAG